MLKIFTRSIIITVFTFNFLLIHQSAAEEKKQPTISINGTGSVSVAPDMAILTFGVIHEADTARQALDANNKAMASIIAAMKDNEIEDKDLQTSNFNIQPRYVYPKRKSNGEQPRPRITGYKVSNTISVRVRDIKNVGAILDLSVTLGVNSGGNIQFTNADTSKVLKEARIKAVKNAIEKAQTLANAANVKLGAILNISENSHRPRPIAIAAQSRSLAADVENSVPISGGENSYRVDVQMSWEILQ